MKHSMRKKLSVEQVAAIRPMYVEVGMTIEEIADVFCVSHSQVGSKLKMEHLTEKEIKQHFDNYVKRHPENKSITLGHGMRKTFKPKDPQMIPKTEAEKAKEQERWNNEFFYASTKHCSGCKYTGTAAGTRCCWYTLYTGKAKPIGGVPAYKCPYKVYGESLDRQTRNNERWKNR